jgi:DNA excision repair protein ERCC-3
VKGIKKMIELQKELENIKNDVDIKLGKLADINQRIKEQEDNLSYVSDKIDKRLGDVLEKDKFLAFFQKPYVIIPQNKEKVLVAVPKFIKNFQVGWLWKETDNYYIYQLDQYSAWLGDVPTDLLQEIDLKKVFNEVYVEGNVIKFSQADKEAVKQKLKYHIKDIGEGEASITRGHTFDVIAEIIKSGCLPFKPRMVSKDDLRTPKGEIKLRPYQNEAYQKFLNTGAVGVFHPTGAGKSFISLYAIDCLKGRKVIITPTTTLTEQWKYYIEKFIPHAKDEIDIVTYQGFRKYDEEYSLVIFDECQRLPANTFSRLAVIKAKYRLGLSASPHREDGRENYIFALTGFPVYL